MGYVFARIVANWTALERAAGHTRAPAVALGGQVVTAGGRQVPFAFEITDNPARIDPCMTYAVSARVEEGGLLRFVSDQRHAVITRGAPSQVDRVLKAVGGGQP